MALYGNPCSHHLGHSPLLVHELVLGRCIFESPQDHTHIRILLPGLPRGVRTQLDISEQGGVVAFVRKPMWRDLLLSFLLEIIFFKIKLSENNSTIPFK